jgi:hypothetical protein
MPKRRGPAGRAPLDLDDVLASRVKPTAAELLDLIHRINPTGRELGAREAELRYAQKSRLQSFLVRRFAAEIEVVPDPHHEGTVSLQHRGHGRDGCHAVIAALDDDARAWVQLQVDLGAHLSEPPKAPAARPSGRGLPPPDAEDEEADDATPEALVRRAEEAALAYDYERARQDLDKALSASGGAKGPAAALLALLVETLGDDAAALELEAKLPAATLAAPKVRGPLALAAARSGDFDRALALVRGADERLSGAAFAALAATALARGEVERGASHLEQVKRLDPANPALAGLAGEIARARAAERGPAEAELAELVKAGREDEAEKKASSVLARWPESEAARRALRAIEERRRKGEMERLAAEAERMRAIEVADRERREASIVDRIRRLLGAPDPREGLLAYLELDEALRGRVRVDGEIEALRFLDLTGRGAPRARVEAAHALAQARERAAADPEAALGWIAPHLGALERVPAARQLAREVEVRLAERRAARALAEIDAARAALAAGGAEEALRRLAATALGDLPEEARAEATALRARGAREAKVAEVGRLRAAGALFEARALVEELAAEAESEERARWAAERAAIQRGIQIAFCVEVDDEPIPIDELMGDLVGRVSMQDALHWLIADGSAFVMAEGRERWAMVHVIERATLTVRASVLLRAPEIIGNLLIQVIGGTLWMVGMHGAVIALSMGTWEVQVFRSRAEAALSPGSVVSSAALPVSEGGAGPRFLWIVPHDMRAVRARVFDMEHRRLLREIPDVHRVAPIAGASAPRVGCFKLDALVVCEDRGVALPDRRVAKASTKPVSVAAHPEGRGLVVLAQTEAPERDGWGLAWVEAPFEGAARSPQLIEGADGGILAKIASSRDAGLVAIMFRNISSEWELCVLHVVEGALEPLYRVPVSGNTHFLQDAFARRIVALESGRDATVAVEIGRESPELPRQLLDRERMARHVYALADCLLPADRRAEIRKGYQKELSGKSPAAIAAWMRAIQKDQATDPAALVEIAIALEESLPKTRAEAKRLRAWLWEAHRDHADVRLLRADELGREGRWQEVSEVLAGYAGSNFGNDEPYAGHFYHLLTLASLHAGHFDHARKMLEEALAREGPCALEALADLLLPLPDPLTKEAWGPDKPPLVQFVGAAHAADDCLSRGDAEGALAALDRELFWISGDVQLLARLAEASLRTTPDGRRGRFRKITALARFLEAHGNEQASRRKDLPIPGATWERARLDKVAERAKGWLDAQGASEG